MLYITSLFYIWYDMHMTYILHIHMSMRRENASLQWCCMRATRREGSASQKSPAKFASIKSLLDDWLAGAASSPKHQPAKATTNGSHPRDQNNVQIQVGVCDAKPDWNWIGEASKEFNGSSWGSLFLLTIVGRSLCPSHGCMSMTHLS